MTKVIGENEVTGERGRVRLRVVNFAVKVDESRLRRAYGFDGDVQRDGDDVLEPVLVVRIVLRTAGMK